MEYTNDIVDHTQQGDNEIFSLNKIRTKKVRDTDGFIIVAEFDNVSLCV